MIRLQNVLKMSSRRICETSWRRFEDVLKTSWRCLEDVFARRLEDVLKTSWRRLEDVWTRRIYWSWPRRLKDVLKTSFEDVWLIRIYSSSSGRLEDVFWRQDERSLQDVFKTSSSRRMFAGHILPNISRSNGIQIMKLVIAYNKINFFL